MALGGLFAATAMVLKQELLLLIIGGVFLMETISVVLQVLSFKTTGKRIFKMAPIHHHFELCGMKETQVVMMFWGISLVLAFNWIMDWSDVDEALFGHRICEKWKRFALLLNKKGYAVDLTNMKEIDDKEDRKNRHSCL